MFVLDTNVISEFRKFKSGKSAPNVVAWAKRTPTQRLFLSAITVMELESGILQIQRRDSTQGAFLRQWLETQVLPSFSERVLAVDTAVAQRCAALHVPDPQPERDALIAATALVHGMTVVTRNTSDFAPTGVELINPWEPGAPLPARHKQPDFPA